MLIIENLKEQTYVLLTLAIVFANNEKKKKSK